MRVLVRVLALVSALALALAPALGPTLAGVSRVAYYRCLVRVWVRVRW